MTAYYLVTRKQVTRIKARQIRRRTYVGPGWAIVRVGKGTRGVVPEELEGELEGELREAWERHRGNRERRPAVVTLCATHLINPEMQT